MKLNLVLIFSLIIVFNSCVEKDDPEINYIIDRISNIGEFKYDGDKLIQLGNEKISYDENGNLSSSRYYSATDTQTSYNPIWGGFYDSIYTYYLAKRKYVWKENKLLIRITDTLIHKEFNKGLIPMVDVKMFRADTSYFWFNDKGYVDSIVYADNYLVPPRYWAPDKYTNKNSDVEPIKMSLAYEYDDNMNIIRLKNYLKKNLFHKIEYQYDTHPNPYNQIFKLTGGIPETIFYANFSVNNPTHSELTNYSLSSTVPSLFEYKYEYNNNELPVVIYRQSDTVRITYR